MEMGYSCEPEAENDINISYENATWVTIVDSEYGLKEQVNFNNCN